ncbi:hypothetical protein QQF64_030929 [Cirrhinus molitorella]|uniref:Uncharacterized protein n=1 Tax=Cirrhinus molitorella TaxID=172907 RepID=A0ABR3N514_9TELE
MRLLLTSRLNKTGTCGSRVEITFSLNALTNVTARAPLILHPCLPDTHVIPVQSILCSWLPHYNLEGISLCQSSCLQTLKQPTL